MISQLQLAALLRPTVLLFWLLDFQPLFFRTSVGIFSLFSKRDDPPPAPAERVRRAPATPVPPVRKIPPAAVAAVTQQKTVLATSEKIDAIEFEMCSEFVNTANPRAAKPAPPLSTAARRGGAKSSGPAMGASTTFLMGSDSLAETIALSASEAAPAIDEAAILFSLGELGAVEQLLQAAMQGPDLGAERRIAWAMLLDLYQVLHRREQFDELSIAYANQFETSPPAWIEMPATAGPRPQLKQGATPTISFARRLDSNVTAQLEQLQKLGPAKHTIRVEFTLVTDVTPVGCGVLLKILNKIQNSGHDLVLVGALELTLKIRDILVVGRRDETAAPWLLLLEILRLLNLEAAYEDCSIEYCITFEVSPPAFIAPATKVTTAAAEPPAEDELTAQFVMPAEMAASSDELMRTIEAYVAQHQPTVLNCSRLVRVDFNAACQLMTHLEPLVNRGALIRIEEVNHLVAALFRVAGMHEILPIHTRKI